MLNFPFVASIPIENVDKQIKAPKYKSKKLIVICILNLLSLAMYNPKCLD